MITQPLHNRVSPAENSLARYRSYHSHRRICAVNETLKMARKTQLSPETPQSTLVLRNEVCSTPHIVKKLNISYSVRTAPFGEQL